MSEDDDSLKTDFYDRQAREGSAPVTKNLPLMILAAVFAIGILYGAYQALMFVINYDKIQAIRNVAITLQKPELFDGIAKVDVTVQNTNPRTVSNIKFKYSIIGPGGDVTASGMASIPDTVPIGAKRHFQHVTLGPLSASAARMQTELADLDLGPKPNISPDMYNLFVETAALKDEDALSGFKELAQKEPSFAPGFVCLGRAYLGTGDDKNAEVAFRNAVKLDDKSADAHYGLGLVLLNEKKRAEAEKEVGAALNLAPNDPNIQKTIQDNRN